MIGLVTSWWSLGMGLGKVALCVRAHACIKSVRVCVYACMHLLMPSLVSNAFLLSNRHLLPCTLLPSGCAAQGLLAIPQQAEA